MARTAHDTRRLERSRTCVLDAALEVMGERGIAATSIDEIASRSGVAKTTIYRHWPCKSELVLDALSAAADTHQVSPETGSIRDDMVAIGVGFGDVLMHSPLGAMFPSMLAEAKHDPSVAEIRTRFASSRRSALREVVQRGIEEGELAAGTSADEFAAALAGAVLYRHLVLDQPITRGFVRNVVDRALDGSRPTPTTTPRQQKETP